MIRHCPSGKVRYASEHAAQIVLVGVVIARNAGSRTRHETRHYHCNTCGGWHLTSMRHIAPRETR